MKNMEHYHLGALGSAGVEEPITWMRYHLLPPRDMGIQYLVSTDYLLSTQL